MNTSEVKDREKQCPGQLRASHAGAGTEEDT